MPLMVVDPKVLPACRIAMAVARPDMPPDLCKAFGDFMAMLEEYLKEGSVPNEVVVTQQVAVFPSLLTDAEIEKLLKSQSELFERQLKRLRDEPTSGFKRQK